MFDASPDLVIEMEEAGVGVEEILQYARGVLTRKEIRELARGLEVLAAPRARRSRRVEAPRLLTA